VNIFFIGFVTVVALMQSCSNPVTTNFDYLVKINIKSESVITFTDSSRIKIKLFAHDERVADASATNLKTIDTLISAVNGEYTFGFNKSDFESVQPNSRSGEYGYYVTFTIDLNDDRKICVGDYIQDYERSPFVSYSQVDTGDRTIEFYTKEVVSGNCYAY